MQDQGNYAAEYLPQIKYNKYKHIQNTQRYNKKADEGMSYQPDYGQEEIKKKNKQNEKRNNLQKNQPENEEQNQQKICSIKCCFIFLLVLVVVLVIIIYFFFPKYMLNLKIDTNLQIVIMGTNDLNGKVYPTKLFRPDTKQPYNYGGLATLLTLRNIVAKKYDGNFLYLDAGDSVVGGLQSSQYVSSGQIMNDFFKSANLTASTFGDHQFSWGTDFILNYLKGRQTPNLAANIKPIPGKPVWIPNHKNSMISQLQNGIKIGLIGINAEVERRLKNKNIFQFDIDFAKLILNQSDGLKSQGANAIILIAHIENKCDNNLFYGIWTNQNNSQICPGNQIFDLIDKLPNGTIDAVVQGHSRTVVHNYYKGIPIMGTPNGGYYTNFLYLNFDKEKKLINSLIEGPVPICQKVFENTQRCDYVEAAEIQKAGQLIPFKFHGVDVTPNEQFNQLIKSKWDQKMSQYKNSVMAYTEITLAPVYGKENQLGNLFTNLLKLIVPNADFVILDTQMFQSQWYPGPIDQNMFFNMFPFENTLISFTMTGSDLIKSLDDSKMISFSVWNIKPMFKISKQKNTLQIILPSIFANLTTISPRKFYKGVSITFTNDRDRDIFPQFKIIDRFTHLNLHGSFRHNVKPYFKNYGIIRKGSLIDPTMPRTIVHYVD